MRSERLLGWIIALMAAQGSLMLSLGSQNPILPVLTTTAAFTSLYVTDRKGWFYLRGSIAGLAASCAVLVAIYDFFELAQERQLLAIAYLLVYLQVVLFYQQKTDRIYWQLQLLSLLQVVVAAVLNLTIGFGFLLILYLFLSLWAGFVFFVTRQRQRALAVSAELKPSEPDFHAESIAEEQADNFHPRLAILALRQTAVIGFMAFITFLLLPRMSDSTLYRDVTGQRVIGFINSVRLGELGTAVENREPVLRLWFYPPESDEPFRLRGQPLLRGSIVNYYQNGTWSIAGGQLWNGAIELPIAAQNATRQRIAMPPQREQTIFAVFPPAVFDPNTPIAFNMRSKQLVRTISPAIPLDFILAAPGIEHRHQLALTPADAFDSAGGAATLQPFDPAEQPGVSTRRLEPLRLLAEEILAESEVALEGTAEQSQALCKFLKNSPKFGYSLTIESRNPKLDPIVDFLTENPQGNCEYFSSALTLMLRSVGIRSRMIIGYQGSEWNPLGGYYQIRQQDAHSWTEAYVPPGELKDMPSGAWLRLDPTPGRMQIDEQESSWWITRVYQQMRNYTEFLWANYVIRLDSRRQREEIYSRVTRWGNSILNAFSQLLRGEQSADGEDETGEQQADSASPASAMRWLRWLIVTLSLLALAVGIWWVRLLYRAGLGTGNASPARRSSIPERPFYRRWKRLLAHHITPRQPAESARQHAASISGWLVECGLPNLADAPYRLVDAHYAHVFGGIAPSAEAESELMATVKLVETALASGARRGLKTP